MRKLYFWVCGYVYIFQSRTFWKEEEGKTICFLGVKEKCVMSLYIVLNFDYSLNGPFFGPVGAETSLIYSTS